MMGPQAVELLHQSSSLRFISALPVLLRLEEKKKKKKIRIQGPQGFLAMSEVNQNESEKSRAPRGFHLILTGLFKS